MIRTIRAFLSNQDGATAIEYALIASLIAVFIIGALSALGTSLSSEFAEVGARAQITGVRRRLLRSR